MNGWDRFLKYLMIAAVATTGYFAGVLWALLMVACFFVGIVIGVAHL